MMDTEKLRQELLRDEGFIPHAYKDSEGYLTIGIGRLIDKRINGGISKSEAMILLNNDLQISIMELETNFDWFTDLNDTRQRAIVNMCFNLGLTKLMKFKNMLSAIERQDFDEAADEALDSKWAIQVGARAERIAEMIRYG
jgi:lysozyme